MADEGFKHKLASILSADVEGYSRLMDDDEEAASSPVRTLPGLSKNTELRSAWMVVDAARTTLLLSGYDGALSISTFTCTLLTTAWLCEAALPNG